MSLYDQSLADGAQAIQIFAELAGMDPSAGNTLLPSSSTPVTGLYGSTRVQMLPVPGGGYRKRTEVILSIAREELDAPPPHHSKLVRIDIAPRVTYTVEHIDTQDPVFWILRLVNLAS
jgi:hypothetical protein